MTVATMSPFAEITANILSSNGIKVYLLRILNTWFLTIRSWDVKAGYDYHHIIKEYNGYKVYWDDERSISPSRQKHYCRSNRLKS